MTIDGVTDRPRLVTHKAHVDRETAVFNDDRHSPTRQIAFEIIECQLQTRGRRREVSEQWRTQGIAPRDEVRQPRPVVERDKHPRSTQLGLNQWNDLLVTTKFDPGELLRHDGLDQHRDRCERQDRRHARKG